MSVTTTPQCLHPDKVSYIGKRRAKQAAKQHPKGLCRLCMSGCYRWGFYPCDRDVTHWHCGHWPKEGQS